MQVVVLKCQWKFDSSCWDEEYLPLFDIFLCKIEWCGWGRYWSIESPPSVSEMGRCHHRCSILSCKCCERFRNFAVENWRLWNCFSCMVKVFFCFCYPRKCQNMNTVYLEFLCTIHDFFTYSEQKKLKTEYLNWIKPKYWDSVLFFRFGSVL